MIFRSRRPSASASTWSATARTATPSSASFSSSPGSTGWPGTTRPGPSSPRTGSTSPAPLQLSSPNKVSTRCLFDFSKDRSVYFLRRNKWSSNENQERLGRFRFTLETADLCPSYSAPFSGVDRYFKDLGFKSNSGSKNDGI